MKSAEAQDYPFLHWQRTTDPVDPPNPAHYINSTAISASGDRVIAGTFYHYYPPDLDRLTLSPRAAEVTVHPGEISEFSTYCFDRDGKQLWVDKFKGYEGVYTVAISANGNFAASGGWFSNSPFQGFIRAYDVDKGPANILDFRTPERVNSLALTSDGTTLVAGCDKVYLFTQSDGFFSDAPSEFNLIPAPPPTPEDPDPAPNSAQSVSISSDGSWILIGDYYGNVYYIQNNNGSFGTVYGWSEPSVLSTIHSVAMTPDGQWFAVAGGGKTSTVYLFNYTSITFGPPMYAGTYTLDTGSRVGWVAITDDGSFLTAVGNIKQGTGSVVAINNDQGTMTKAWEETTNYNPNSTSMDASGKFVAVADGYGGPGSFTLFDGKGNKLWSYPTTEMNWPMFISADGSGIAAGTDAGTVYYFTPGTPSEDKA